MKYYQIIIFIRIFLRRNIEFRFSYLYFLGSFHLDKWYFDLISDKDDAMIAYTSKISWKKIELNYSSLIACNDKTRQISSLKKSKLPQFSPGQLTYQNNLFSIELRSMENPLKQVLLDSPAGKIIWECHYPKCEIKIGGKEFMLSGLGYAEQLSMDFEPWKLDIDELYWGRFISENYTIVWIAWKGAMPLQFAWINGDRTDSLMVGDDTIRAGETEIKFSERKIIRAGVLSNSVFKKFLKIFPFKVLHSEEFKWMARADLYRENKLIEQGKCIFEKVIWKK